MRKERLPTNWKAVKLGEVCDIVDGDRGSNYPKQSDFSDKGFCLFLNAGNVSKNGFNFENCQFISEDKDKILRSGRLKENDIIITTRGAIGNIAHYNKDIGFESIRINSGMAILRISDNNLNDYFLNHFCKSQIIEKQIKQVSFGSAQQQLTIGLINNLFLRLPPLPEQKRIASCLTAWDEGIEKLKKLIEAKKKLKKGLMQILLKPFDKKDARQKTMPQWFKTAKWESVVFEDVFYIVSGTKKIQIQTLQYLEYGKYPIVNQGQKDVVGYTNSEEIFKDVPVIIFGDHTRIIKYITFPFGIGADDTQLIKTQNNIDLRFGYFLLCSARIQNLGYSRHLKELKEKQFLIPPPSKHNKKNRLSPLKSR